MNSFSNVRADGTISQVDAARLSGHGVCWSTIIGGAVAAVAVSIILFLLGSALGFSSIAPGSLTMNTVSKFTLRMAAWLIIMQWLSAGLGGYLAGRLRTKWIGLHTDEVFFRDTAHGFLAWALATVVTVALFASAATSAVSGGVHAATAVATGAAAGASQAEAQKPSGDGNGYYIDSLFRSTSTNPNASAKDVRGETTRILSRGVKNGVVPDADKTYLAQLVSSQAGISQAEASKRVDDTIAELNAAKDKAAQDAEAARKTAMQVTLFTFFSMLIGAFIASTAAAIGGSQRDEY